MHHSIINFIWKWVWLVNPFIYIYNIYIIFFSYNHNHNDFFETKHGITLISSNLIAFIIS
jgi:hypothetical protein